MNELSGNIDELGSSRVNSPLCSGMGGGLSKNHEGTLCALCGGTCRRGAQPGPRVIKRRNCHVAELMSGPRRWPATYLLASPADRCVSDGAMACLSTFDRRGEREESQAALSLSLSVRNEIPLGPGAATMLLPPPGRRVLLPRVCLMF